MRKPKKLLFLVIVFTCFQTVSFSQKAFYNAIKINYYYNEIDSTSEFIKGFYENPFNSQYNTAKIDSLLDVIDASVRITEDGKIIQASGNKHLSQGSPNGFTFISTTSQSAIIDGTAKFLAERFKEEATILYINKFKQKLDSVPELQILYPKTYSFLKDADFFNYSSLGNDFKEAFEEDIQNILFNLNQYILDNKELKKKLEEAKLYYPFNFSFSLSNRLIKGDHPIDLLAYLEKKYETTDKNDGFYNYYNIIHGINIIQNNLQKISTSEDFYSQFKNVWLKVSNLKELDESKEIELFAALIFHEDTSYFTNVLSVNSDNAADFFNKTVYPIIGILNTIENYQSKETLVADDYITIMDNTFELVKYADKKTGNNLSNSISFKTKEDNEVEIDPIEFMQKTLDLYESIYSKNYGYVVTNSLYITEKVLLACGSSNVEVLKITQGISKYGGFMVDVVKAENSDDVKTLIQKNVTKYSYLDKRRSKFNITISAHPGIFVGNEYLVNELSDFRWDKGKMNLGITTPIGFEFMWSVKKENSSISYISKKTEKTKVEGESKKKKVTESTIKYLTEGSWSIFASIVDIGAAFNYRLNDSKSQLPSELTFKQVFSPGISLNWAFKNSPLTLGAGIQYTPELREITTDNIVAEENSIRMMLRLSWDIPMVKIYSKN